MRARYVCFHCSPKGCPCLSLLPLGKTGLQGHVMEQDPPLPLGLLPAQLGLEDPGEAPVLGGPGCVSPLEPCTQGHCPTPGLCGCNTGTGARVLHPLLQGQLLGCGAGGQA